MRTRAILVSVAGLWLASSSGLSQQQPEKRTTKADLPGKIHDQLNALAGTWDVSIKFKLGDKFQEGRATCEAKSILGGRFLQQEYNSRFQGAPFAVVQILGYDNTRKKFVEFKIDSMSTRIMHNEGDISEDGRVITSSGESTDPATGKPYKLRTVYTLTDRDHFTLDWLHVEDGGKEEKVVTLSHTRKKQ